MGYRDDANWGLGNLGPHDRVNQTNPVFVYPSRSIRFMEGQAAVDDSQNTYQLQRGYIRNLELPIASSTNIYKCAFQFNPQTISQTVGMREDMYLAILQDPAQLAQPIGASTNFSFDLLFDRQLEMATGGVNLNVGPDSDLLADRNTLMDAAKDIGVYADLQVLYAVIGQGFNANLIDQQLERVLSGAERVFGSRSPENPNNDAGDDSSSTTDTTNSSEGAFTYDSNDARSILAANAGNAAILMPNPVRILFSSMFMVDGFITGTSVDFLKFNTKMVPVQCKVTLSMNAVYIGFARNNTFLVSQLEAAKRAIVDQNNRSASGNIELITALKKTANSITFGFGADTATINNFTESTKAWAYYPQTGARTWNARNFFFRFDSVTPIEGPGSDRDEVLKLYEAGVAVTGNWRWSLTIYGIPGVASSAADMQNILNNNGIDDDGVIAANYSNLKILGSYSGEHSTSSKSEWGAGSSGSGAGKNKVRRLSKTAPGDSENTNNAEGAPTQTIDPFDDSANPNSRLGINGSCIARWSLNMSFKKEDLNDVYPKSVFPGKLVGNEIVYTRVVSNNNACNVNFTIGWEDGLL
jgi:hypothetical protein